jgi:hypothetical protein
MRLATRHEVETRRDGGEPQACDVVFDMLADYEGIDTNSGNITLYDYIEPDALNSLFAHNPEAITAVAIEIEEVIVTVWENDGLYAHVSDSE